MEYVLLRNKKSLLYIIVLLLLNCSEGKSEINLNSDLRRVSIQNFIPTVIKGKKYTIVAPMSTIYEDKYFTIKQHDNVTFVIINKFSKYNYCIKYSGGDNIYLDKSLKPTAIFRLDSNLFPISGILVHKNKKFNDYSFLKFEYTEQNVFKLTAPNKIKEDFLLQKFSDIQIIFNKIENKNFIFAEKTEILKEFNEIPLWEISW